MDGRSFFKKSDIVVVALLAVLSFCAYLVMNTLVFSKGNASYAEIIYDGKIIMKADLNNDNTFSLEEVPGISFQIKGGTIRFLESNCKDEICVNAGALSHTGQSAACLPNKVSVSLKGGIPAEIDVIAK